jgi:hypothetical protein
MTWLDLITVSVGVEEAPHHRNFVDETVGKNPLPCAAITPREPIRSDGDSHGAETVVLPAA